MKNKRLEELLVRAQGGDDNARKELFTRGGCHALAFAKALQLNGAAVLMTTIAVKGTLDSYIKETIHAWCEVDSRYIDYFGDANDQEAILARLSDKLAWSPKFTAGTKPHFVQRYSPVEIRELLTEKQTLPNGYYDDIEWLRGALDLASQMTH